MSFLPPTPRQARLIWIALTGLAIATVIALVVAAIWGLGQVVSLLAPAIWPLCVAAVIACLLSPVVDWLERRKIARTRAIILVFIIAITIVAGIAASVVPQVVRETRQLASKIPDYYNKLETNTEHLMNESPEFLRRMLPQYFSASTNTISSGTNGVAVQGATLQLNKGTLSPVTEWVQTKLWPWIQDQFSNIGSWIGILVGFALIPVYTFYFLIEKRGIKTHWKEYLPVRDSRLKDELVFVLDSINDYLVAFFRGQVLVAICDSVLYTISFLVIGLNYAFLLGFLALVLTMIPFVGPLILCILSLGLTFAQYTDWQHPLMVMAAVVVIQTLEQAYISPKIMGHRVNLHPVVIIVAVMTGTELLGGLLGGILAIPLAAALRVILFRYVWKRRPANELD